MSTMPFVKLSGDRRRARTLRGFALTQLQTTEDLMKYRDLKQYKRKITLADGSIITCKVQFGIPQVEIYVPPVSGGEEEFGQSNVAYLIPFWYEKTTPFDKEAHIVVGYGVWKSHPPYEGRIHTKPVEYDESFEIPVNEPFTDSNPESNYVAYIGAVSSYTRRQMPVPEDEDSGYSIAVFRHEFWRQFTGFAFDPYDSCIILRSYITFSFGSLGESRVIQVGVNCLATNFFLHEDGSVTMVWIAEELWWDGGTRKKARLGIATFDIHGDVVAGGGTYYTPEVGSTGYLRTGCSVAFDGVTVYTDFPFTTGYMPANFPYSLQVNTGNKYGYDPVKKKVVIHQVPATYAKKCITSYGEGPYPSEGWSGGYYHYYWGGGTLSSEHKWNTTFGSEMTASFACCGYLHVICDAPNGTVLSIEIEGTIGYLAGTYCAWTNRPTTYLPRFANYYDFIKGKWIFYDLIILKSYTATQQSDQSYNLTTENILYIYNQDGEIVHQRSEGVFNTNDPMFTWSESGGAVGVWQNESPLYSASYNQTTLSTLLRELRIALSQGIYYHDSRDKNGIMFRQDYKNTLDLEDPEFSAEISLGKAGGRGIDLPVQEWRYVSNSNILGIGEDPFTYKK